MTEDKRPVIDVACRPETLTARAGGYLCRETGAIIPPIHLSTTYARDERYERIGGHRGYSRDDNPTFEQAEAVLAALEKGHAARLYASGMAAISAVFQAMRPGDHVVASKQMYFGTSKWIREMAVPFGIDVEFVETSDIDAVQRTVRPGRTRLVYIETPSNPAWAVTDIRSTATIAHAAGALLCVDNTAATPVHQRPIEHGADLVVHSATKYLNGHSDVVAGALVTAAESETWLRAARLRYLQGAVPGPFEAWLLLRGMRTLFLRVRQASASAMAIARHFEHHPAIAQVCYPGLESFPGHRIACAQMTDGFGGMLSLRLKGGGAAALSLVSKVRIFVRATSLGGVESLIEHRHTIEAGETDTPADMLRLSIGIEATEDLIEDLERALK